MEESKNLEWNVAKIIHDSWDILINDFLSYTAQGKEKFEQRKFKELFGLAVNRFKLYSIMTQKACQEIEVILGDQLHDTRIWEKIKHYYFHLIQNRYDKPNTETFYNSVSRKIFNQIRIGFSQQFEFFENEDYHVVEFTDPKVFREIPVSRLNENVLKDLLLSLDFNIEWENIDRDCEEIMNKLAPIIVFQKNNLFLDSIEVVNTIFYRNRGAFVLGKLRYRRWTMPFAIALLNESKGLFVDAFIHTESDISILFSFTRSSFLANTRKPVELIDYLKTMLPYKPMAELYDAIGYFRNGKTRLYQDLMNYIRNFKDEFIIAPGIKGMVMCVFTLKNYPFVFKIIKDKFDNPKNVTREKVIQQYRSVELNDRVGRMIYAQQFEYLRFEKHLFSEELLKEFEEVATHSVEITEKHVTILHCYIERKLVPLNLYLHEASTVETCKAMIDYGNCIKELAKSNIFPGDMLMKNFGVTRHGRVIFYDYDEIMPLTECKFRRLPEASDVDEMYGHTPTVSAGINDIFPEEFKNFMIPGGAIGDLFLQEHADLFTPKFWRRIQRENQKGNYMKFYAYPSNYRFTTHKSDSDAD
ncbi:MAG: bifunctional isocitrate dehydrogenase kinase/phosphatase [Chitinophagales bacterium]|nr:bifunctional isocitrate dehydrogenase kinase/phosphatase [Chitinophagales bacterium]